MAKFCWEGGKRGRAERKGEEERREERKPRPVIHTDADKATVTKVLTATDLRLGISCTYPPNFSSRSFSLPVLSATATDSSWAH
jgi:hypothetical protein